jgi:hypothetical protein
MNEIKIVNFKGKLFRANRNIFNKFIYKANTKKNILASINYKNAPMKYFTLKRSNVEPYTSEGTTYIKNWNVTSELSLVDILDLRTRELLENKFKTNILFKNAINAAFPINEGKVYRISSSNEEDNKVLEKICELGYDGYYMNVEGKNMGFHSEIGLCKRAFSKLKLSKNAERKSMPEKTRKRSKLEYYNKNIKQISPIKRSPFRGSLFGKLNNIKNNNV